MDFKKELEKQIIEKESKFDRNKTRRAALIFLIMLAVNTVFFYFVLCCYEGHSFNTLLDALALSLGYCVIFYLGYVFLFFKWFEKNKYEEKALKTLKDMRSKID